MAVPLILFMEGRDAQFVRDREENIAAAAREAASAPAPPSKPAPAPATSEQKGETVSFSPCGMWADYPPQMTIVELANPPAFALTGWQMACPPDWSLAGRLHANWEQRTIESQRRVDLIMVILIAIQWFLVGGFPLTRSLRWWEEPGAIITVGVVASGLLVLIPNNGYDSMANAPVLFAWLAWFWWFGLLVSKSLRSGWHLARRVVAHDD